MEVDIEDPRVEVDLVFASLTTSSPTALSTVMVTVDSPDGARVSCSKMNGRGGVECKLCINLNYEKGNMRMSNDKYFAVLI